MPVDATITATIMPAMDDDGCPTNDGRAIVHLYRTVRAGLCGPWGQYDLDTPSPEAAAAALAEHGWTVTGDWTHRMTGTYGLTIEAVVVETPRPAWTPPVMEWSATA